MSCDDQTPGDQQPPSDETTEQLKRGLDAGRKAFKYTRQAQQELTDNPPSAAPLIKRALGVAGPLNSLVKTGGDYINAVKTNGIESFARTGSLATGVASGVLALAITVTGPVNVPALLLASVGFAALSVILDAMADAQERAAEPDPIPDQPCRDEDEEDPFNDPPVSPLIIDMDGDGVEVTSLADSATYFDLDRNGFAERTAWVDGGDALLAYDRNADGEINDGSELFGSPTQDGFAQLAALDSNRDGMIDGLDTEFDQLRVWVDVNKDGKASESELRSLSEAGIVSLTANGQKIVESNNGNPVTHRGSATFADGRKVNIDDVWFQNNRADARAILSDDFVLDPRTAVLPNLLGWGAFADLNVVATRRPELLEALEALVVDSAQMDGTEFRSAVEDILFLWAGADDIDPSDERGFANARHLAVLEGIYGQGYIQTAGMNAGTSDPGPNAANEMELKYQAFLDQMVTRLAAQILPSQLALANEGRMEAEAVLGGGFVAMWPFVYNKQTDSVGTFDFVAAVQGYVDVLPEDQDAAMRQLDLFMTTLRGAKEDIFGGDSGEFAAALNAGLAGLADRAMAAYALAIATSTGQVEGTADSEMVDTGDPVPHPLVRRLDGKASVVLGREGDDTLTGGKGGDTYVFRRGDGNDVVIDDGAPDIQIVPRGSIKDGNYSGNRGGTDQLIFLDRVSTTATFTRQGGDLLIAFSDTPDDGVAVRGFFEADGKGQIEKIVLSDRTISAIEILALNSEAVDTTGGPGTQRVTGTSADDTLDGGAGSDLFYFGSGSGRDVIVRGPDTGSAQDSLSLAFSSEDAFIYRSGADLIVRFYQESVDQSGNVVRALAPDALTVKNQFPAGNIYSGSIDLLVFADGQIFTSEEVVDMYYFAAGAITLPYALEDVTFSRVTGDYGYGYDLLLQVDGVEVLRVAEQFIGGGYEVITFANGTSLSRAQLAERVPLVGSEGDDYLFATDDAEVINGGGGNDHIDANGGDDVIDGGKGDDYLVGDEIIRFEGDAAGSDTYLYRAGDGNDTITDQGTGGLDVDRLRLLDLNPDDVVLTRVTTFAEGEVAGFAPASFDEEDEWDGGGTQYLLIKVKATGEVIRVNDQFLNDLDGFEAIEFADGTIYDRPYLIANVPLVDDERGGEELAGTGVIDAGDRFASVYGAGDADTLVFSGIGSDQTAYEFETIRLDDMDVADARFNRVGLDLVITDSRSGRKLVVPDHFSDSSFLQRVVFQNGDEWDAARIALEAAIAGTPDADALLGSDDDEVFAGGAGEDEIDGGAGDDRIDGGADADVLSGGAGDDRFLAADGDGDDVIDGGDDLDAYDASTVSGPVSIDLGAGTAVSAAGTDELISVEVAIGGSADDALAGSEADDTLVGGRGNDTLRGRGGDDVLVGGIGADALDGGDGYDVADYSGARGGIDLSLAGGAGTRGDAAGDTLVDVEGVIGTNYADNVFGNVADNNLRLGGGNDIADGGSGDDILDGAAGADHLMGGDGRDTLRGASGSDLLEGGVGDDVLEGGLGADRLFGGTGSDTYLWTTGDGSDLIVEADDESAVDELLIHGRAPSQVRIESLRGDVFLIGPGGETLTLRAQLTAGSIETVRFDDGTAWSAAYLAANAVERPNGMVLALDEGVRTDEDTSLTLRSEDLLVNDFDANGDSLAIDAVLNAVGGSVELLPSGEVRFTPATNFNGDASFDYVAVDGFGSSSTATVLVNVSPVNDAPVLNQPVGPQAAREGTAFSLILSAEAFLDVDQGDRLTLSATMVDGRPLPHWLTFDPQTRTFSGTPGATDAGALAVRVTATDSAGATALADFAVEVAPLNRAPIVNGSIATQQATEDQAFAFTMPSDLFVDPDPGDQLTLSVTRADGSPLPMWLSFDPGTGTLSGVPLNADVGSLELKLVATDPSGSSAVTTFSVTVANVNDAPVARTEVPRMVVAEDTAFDIAIPADLFADEDGDAVAVTAALADGSALPSWLSFDGVRFTGTPPSNFNGALDVRLTGSDGVATATAGFAFEVIAVNDAPVAGDNTLYNVASGGEARITAADLLANDSDVDGDALTIVAVSAPANGTARLEDDGSVVYTPNAGYAGADSIVYTVSDGELTTTATIEISVVNPDPYAGWQQGTAGNDFMFGRLFTANRIYGAGGNDLITGGTAADMLAGGSGNDVVAGLGGNDAIEGNAGDDMLSGGSGDDTLTGGVGNDVLSGDFGMDTAVFAGERSTYTLQTVGGTIKVADNAPGADGDDGADTLIGVERAQFKGGAVVSLAAPVVLDLDGDGVELVERANSRARFDWDGDGKRDRTGWAGKDDGILVLDRDGDGKVSGASELSFLDDKEGAKSDLDGLSAFDTNGDGALDADDERFGSFMVWRDRDGDGKVDKRELVTLAEAGVAAIGLASTSTDRAWEWGTNVTINTGSFVRTDGTSGRLADVALAYDGTRGRRYVGGASGLSAGGAVPASIEALALASAEAGELAAAGMRPTAGATVVSGRAAQLVEAMASFGVSEGAAEVEWYGLREGRHHEVLSLPDHRG